MNMLPDQPHRSLVANLTYQQAISLKTETDWERLRDITVQNAIVAWLQSITNLNTRDNYAWGFDKLVGLGLLELSMTLQEFALLNHDSLVDQIKRVEHWSEATRQARAAAFLAFVRFLSRRTQRLIQRATPSTEGTDRTFFPIRKEVATPAMTQAQWTAWLNELAKISIRDTLIAKVTLQGGKRISEVLSLTVNRIDFANRRITFKQSKTKGTIEETIITYPLSVMDDLEQYIGDREGLVFVTRSGRAIVRQHLNRSFAKAGERARLPFRITPHVLRASCVTFLLQQKFSDSEIMRVTGHSSSRMISAYDKRQKTDNVTTKISLVT